MPDAYRIQMEAEAFNDRIRGVLTRFVRDIFVIVAVTASFTMPLCLMVEKAALEIARHENKSIVFQAAENRTKIWLRFGGRYFWQRSDPRWWCVEMGSA